MLHFTRDHPLTGRLEPGLVWITTVKGPSQRHLGLKRSRTGNKRRISRSGNATLRCCSPTNQNCNSFGLQRAASLEPATVRLPVSNGRKYQAASQLEPRVPDIDSGVLAKHAQKGSWARVVLELKCNLDMCVLIDLTPLLVGSAQST